MRVIAAQPGAYIIEKRAPAYNMQLMRVSLWQRKAVYSIISFLSGTLMRL